MINPDICEIKTVLLETNKFTDTQSPTDTNDLYPFIDIDILVLQGCFIAFPYRQAAQMVKGQSANQFVSKPFVSMSWRKLEGVCPYLYCIDRTYDVLSSLTLSDVSRVVVSGAFRTEPSDKKNTHDVYLSEYGISITSIDPSESWLPPYEGEVIEDLLVVGKKIARLFMSLPLSAAPIP